MATLTQFDEGACVAAITRLAARVEDPTYFRLGQLLYLAEKLHLEHYGRCICGDSYAAMNQGPVPSRVYDALKALSGRGDPRDRETQQVARRLAKYLAHDGGIRFRVLEDADVGALSEPDVEYLDEVGERYGRQSFPGLPALTHDAAYEVARARAESQSA